MRVLALGQAERGREVLGQVRDLVDGGQDLLVDLLLVGGLGLGERLLLLLAVLEELALGALARRSLLLGEVGVVKLAVEL